MQGQVTRSRQVTSPQGKFECSQLNRKVGSDVEKMVTACPGCQPVQKEQPAVFIHTWEQTARPWERVHLDFAGPFRGSYFLVIVDSHSKWPEVFIMKDITTQRTIVDLAKIFAEFGNPVQLVTDSRPQLTAKEFEDLMTTQDSKHIIIAPYRLQANGLSERMVQTANNSLRAHLSGGDQRQLELQLASFLLQYRNTPHNTTGVAPVDAIAGKTCADQTRSAEVKAGRKSFRCTSSANARPQPETVRVQNRR